MKFLSEKTVLIGAISAVIIGLAVIHDVNFYINNKSKEIIYSAEDNIPEKQAILVLGTRVYGDDRLSPMLRDRVSTAVDLYEKSNGAKIIASGDNGQEYYDEVNAMKLAFLEAGIPPEDIFLDHAGFDTYDSVYRAKEIFDVDSMIIVTQRFHLPRALYIADALGIDAVGASADMRKYSTIASSIRREQLANIKAFINVNTNAKPKFLGDKIPITGDGQSSWD